MSDDEIRESIRQFMITHFASARRQAVRDQDPLLESGIIDSLGVLDVVGFLESEFHVTVEDEELIPENFQNIERIAAYVRQKRNGGTSRADRVG
jgi:acyl carrier protein